MRLAGLGIAAGRSSHHDRTDLPIRTSIVVLALGIPATYLLAGWAGPLGAALAYGAMILASRLVSYVQCLRLIPRTGRDAGLMSERKRLLFMADAFDMRGGGEIVVAHLSGALRERWDVSVLTTSAAPKPSSTATA